MLIILRFNKKKPEKQLKEAGYKKRHWEDWIRITNNGRWHLHELAWGVYSIHFDLDVGDKHYAPFMPDKTKREIKRINALHYRSRKKVSHLKFNEVVDKYKGQ